MVLDLLGEGVVITLDRGKTWPVGLNWPNWRNPMPKYGLPHCVFFFLRKWYHVAAAPTINKNETNETTTPMIIEARRLDFWAPLRAASCWFRVFWSKGVVLRPGQVILVEPDNMDQLIRSTFPPIIYLPIVETYCVPVAHRPKLEETLKWIICCDAMLLKISWPVSNSYCIWKLVDIPQHMVSKYSPKRSVSGATRLI